MLSSMDLERLIAEKRLEIEREKSQLGLSQPARDADNCQHEDKENAIPLDRTKIEVTKERALGENNAANRDKKEKERRSLSDIDENIISPDIERHIRRYLGLPVMLKAGEYSPNNPLIRGERSSGDALLGLGEYERRRNTLRKIRQQQYREYLDEQAKKKQEAKEKAERERREREERERLEEERERERLEREERAREDERRITATTRTPERFTFSRSYNDKVDTGVQVGVSRPLSVAVQTDDAELYQLSCPMKFALTQAERELSPRTVVDDARETRPTPAERRNSCQEQYTDRYSFYKKSNRDKLVSDLRHTYMPSILNADDIQQRNLEAQQEAQARRQFYQQELRRQILEQQRLKEERRQRELMLEQAEMRRMEDQLEMLRVAQDKEVGRQREITVAMKENATDYEKKRSSLQNEIEREQKQLIRASTQPYTKMRRENTSYSDRQMDTRSKLPFYYPKIPDKKEKLPYSMNIPDNSIFSSNYDVESYLRKNLNPSRERLLSNRITTSSTDSKNDRIETDLNDIDLEIERIGKNNYRDYAKDRNVEKALIHERPKPKEKYEPSILKKSQIVEENLPIPVLRHSPKGVDADLNENKEDLSDAMKLVDDKWKVPIVQKNILKSMPNSEGRNVNILTQLGSIRRQLQLEQMKLDKLVKKDNE